MENRVNFLRRRVSRSPLIGEYWERGGGASYFLIKSVYQNGKFFYPFESSHSRVSLSIRSLSLVSTSIPDEGKFVRGVRCKLSLSLFLSLCLLFCPLFHCEESSNSFFRVFLENSLRGNRFALLLKRKEIGRFFFFI